MKGRILLVLLVAGFAGLVVWRVQANQAKAATLAQGGGAPGGGGGSGGARSGGGPGGGGAGGGRRPSPTVEVAPAAATVLESRLLAVGTAESPLRVELSPRVSGRILSLTVREGDEVTQGQALVTLDPTELEQRVSEREAAVAEARSRLAQARIQAAPTAANIQGQIQQAEANLASAEANLGQLQQSASA